MLYLKISSKILISSLLYSFFKVYYILSLERSPGGWEENKAGQKEEGENQ